MYTPAGGTLIPPYKGRLEKVGREEGVRMKYLRMVRKKERV